jgi:hypothetical protein
VISAALWLLALTVVLTWVAWDYRDRPAVSGCATWLGLFAASLTVWVALFALAGQLR